MGDAGRRVQLAEHGYRSDSRECRQHHRLGPDDRILELSVAESRLDAARRGSTRVDERRQSGRQSPWWKTTTARRSLRWPPVGTGWILSRRT